MIIAVGFIAYSNTFHSPFLFDGRSEITENPVVKDIRNFSSGWKGYDYNPRRFLGYLSFALNYHFGGKEVAGYHTVNLLIHLGCALLVYLLVLITFRTPLMSRSAISFPSDPDLIALFSSLLFVAHPLQTQAVTYIIQRLASLAAFFYLLSAVMYIKGRQAIEKQADAVSRSAYIKTALFFTGSLVSAVCAMKTKEIAFTLPFVICLYEVVFFKAPSGKRLLFLLPVVLTLIIVPLSIFHADKPLGEVLSELNEKTRAQTQMARSEYFATEMRVIVTYVRLIFLPVNQNLDYDYPVYNSLFTPEVFFSFLFLLSVFGTGVYLLFKAHGALNRQRPASSGKRQFTLHDSHLMVYRLIGFGVLWFFITLSMESGVIPIADVIFEHRLYLPSPGFFIAAATGALVAARRLRIEKIMVITLALLIFIFSGLTYARNAVWNDEIGFWRDVAKKSPEKVRPHYELANAYRIRGLMNRAMEEYEITLRLKPDYPECRNNLGNIYAAGGRLDMAIEEFKTALKSRPDYADAHYNLAGAYEAIGRLDMAIEEYRTVLRLKPDYAEAFYNLAGAYMSGGRTDAAIEQYKASLRLRPDYAEAHNNLGIAYASKGLLDMAIQEYETALRLRPDYAKARANLEIAKAAVAVKPSR